MNCLCINEKYALYYIGYIVAVPFHVYFLEGNFLKYLSKRLFQIYAVLLLTFSFGSAFHVVDF